MADQVTSSASPVRTLPTDLGASARPGIALCLSGGGYRAMLFHLGALWRLNELGLMKKLAKVSSVSGGSITAGQLGVKWSSLNFQGDVATNFTQLIVDPIRGLANIT